MRVLHVLNSNRFSGAENVVCQIIGMFRNSEDVGMAYCSSDGQIRDKLKRKEINFLPMQKLTVKSLKKVIKEFNPDIIHAHDFRASVLATRIGFKGAIISHIHNNSPFMRTWNIKSLIYFMCLKKFRHVLGVSQSVFDECVFKAKLSEKFKLMPNPIDFKALNSHYSKEQKIYDIAFVGRLSPPKNPIRFIEILEKIHDVDSSVRAVMVGDGELMDPVQKAVVERNLSSVIDIVGFQENPYEYLNKSRMMFLTSEWEGFGLVIVEAMALGVPVAGTRVGGVPQLINGDCGALCDSDDDFMDFYNRMKNVEEYSKLVVGAIKRAGGLDNVHSYRSNLLEIYQHSIKLNT